MKMRSIKQFTKIILNSDDATLTQSQKSVSSRGRVFTFDATDAAIVNATTENITIYGNGLATGNALYYEIPSSATAIGGLTKNTIYYIVKVNDNQFKLAATFADAIASTPVVINIIGVGTGGSHTFTVYNVLVYSVSNYNFKLTNINPSVFGSKTRLAVQSFYWSPTPESDYTNKIGNVYIKNIPQADIYSTQGMYKGIQLLANNFSKDKILYENPDIYQNYIKLPINKDFLQNGIDILIDTKKFDDTNVDIAGNIVNDSWQLALILYDIEDDEYLYQDMSQKQRNYTNVALS